MDISFSLIPCGALEHELHQSQPVIACPVLAGHAEVWGWGGRFPVEGRSWESSAANMDRRWGMDAPAGQGIWAELQQHPLQKARCHLRGSIDTHTHTIVHAWEP